MQRNNRVEARTQELNKYISIISSEKNDSERGKLLLATLKKHLRFHSSDFATIYNLAETANYKELVLQQILATENALGATEMIEGKEVFVNSTNPRMQLLSDALNPESALGAFFWRKRGNCAPNLEAGTLAKLYKAFYAEYSAAKFPELAKRISLVTVPVLSDNTHYDSDSAENLFVNTAFFEELLELNKNAPEKLFRFLFPDPESRSTFKITKDLRIKIYYLSYSNIANMYDLVGDYFSVLHLLLKKGCDERVIAKATVEATNIICATNFKIMPQNYSWYSKYLELCLQFQSQDVEFKPMEQPVRLKSAASDVFVHSHLYHIALPVPNRNIIDPAFAGFSIPFAVIADNGTVDCQVLLLLIQLDRLPDQMLRGETIIDSSDLLAEYIVNLSDLTERKTILALALNSESSLNHFFKSLPASDYARLDAALSRELAQLNLLLERNARSRATQSKRNAANAMIELTDLSAQPRLDAQEIKVEEAEEKSDISAMNAFIQQLDIPPAPTLSQTLDATITALEDKPDTVKGMLLLALLFSDLKQYSKEEALKILNLAKLDNNKELVAERILNAPLLVGPYERLVHNNKVYAVRTPSMRITLLAKSFDHRNSLLGMFFMVARGKSLPSNDTGILHTLYKEFERLYALEQHPAITQMLTLTRVPFLAVDANPAFSPNPQDNVFVNVNFFKDLLAQNKDAPASALFGYMFLKPGEAEPDSQFMFSLIQDKLFQLPSKKRSSISFLLMDYLQVLEHLLDRHCNKFIVANALINAVNVLNKKSEISTYMTNAVYANIVNLARKLTLADCPIREFNQDVVFNHARDDDSVIYIEDKSLRYYRIDLRNESLSIQLPFFAKGTLSYPWMAKIIFNLIAAERVSKQEIETHLKFFKGDVLDYIASLPDLAERKIVLQNALDPETRLNHFFSIQRGIDHTTMRKGSFERINQLLAEINAKPVDVAEEEKSDEASIELTARLG